MNYQEEVWLKINLGYMRLTGGCRRRPCHHVTSPRDLCLVESSTVLSCGWQGLIMLTIGSFEVTLGDHLARTPQAIGDA